MTPEERFNRLEENYNILTKLLIETKSLAERAQAQSARLESQTGMLIELVRDHDERMQTQLTWINQLGEAQDALDFKLNASQAAFDFKLNALTDAQIRTEEKLSQLSDTQNKLGEAQIRTEERLDKLAEAQLRNEERLDKLSDTQNKLSEAQIRTEEKLSQLGEAQLRTEERLDRLSDAQTRTEAALLRLAEAQASSDRRFNEFVDVVQKRWGDAA